MRWYREGAPVKDVSSLETRVTIRRDGSLVINPVSSDDSGQYMCEVSNGIGEPQSASAYLNVECMLNFYFNCYLTKVVITVLDPAKVTFTPTVQYLPFRLAGVVQCYIKANPPLQYVTWTKDKRLLEPYQTKVRTKMFHLSKQHQTNYSGLQKMSFKFKLQSLNRFK